MLEECREHLALAPGELFCDCTFGLGGHSRELAAALLPDGAEVAFDQDQTVLDEGSRRLTAALPSLHFKPLHANFRQIDQALVDLEVAGADAFLFDLGISSVQVDRPERGFSYAHDAPLDMRMDPDKQTLTAAELLNTANEAELIRILREYGEERQAPRIVRAIVARRRQKPLERTSELADLIYQAIPAALRKSGGHPAKRTFQALRIYLNDELGALSEGLDAAIRWLNPGGRLVVISYHSLEDRIVKRQLTQNAKACICPPEQPVCTCGGLPVLSAISHGALIPSPAEVARNPRARSAKLRWAVKR
jgi:16S rRNA (cytosine1402-N4)-methyltransferase